MDLPADESRAVVLLDRSNYDGKVFTMLSDTKTYQKLKRDPAPALEKKMKAILWKL